MNALPTSAWRSTFVFDGKTSARSPTGNGQARTRSHGSDTLATTVTPTTSKRFMRAIFDANEAYAKNPAAMTPLVAEWSGRDEKSSPRCRSA